MEGSRVTVTFELTPEIDPKRFVEWLQVECAEAEDGDKDEFHGRCKILPPVIVSLYYSPRRIAQ